MGKKTRIEWCDATWNPITGCFHRCEYCYARRIAKRFSYEGQTLNAPLELQGIWIKDKRGLAPGLHVLRQEVRLKERDCVVPYPFGFSPTFHRYKLGEPMTWKEPLNIFVCSMADLFGEWVPEDWIGAVFDACDAAPQHNYIFLTKNPARYIELNGKFDLRKDNWWFGTTVTTPNQAFLYAYTDSELHTFISIEPMMEEFGHLEGARPDWIIVGAETGNRKGRITPERSWIDNLSAECKQWSIPLFMKDSLTKIVGEENMWREFPEGLIRP